MYYILGLSWLLSDSRSPGAGFFPIGSQIVKIGERRIFTEKKIFSICVLNV